MYSPYIMYNVRQALGYDPDDDSKDSVICKTYSRTEILGLFLQWEGIIVFEYKVINAIEDIFEVVLEE